MIEKDFSLIQFFINQIEINRNGMSRKLIDDQLNMMHSHMKNLVYDLSGKMEISFLYNNYLLMARDNTISPDCQFDSEQSCEQFMTRSVEEFRERLLTDELNRIINFLFEKFEQIENRINDLNFSCDCRWDLMRSWLRESLKQIDSNNSDHNKYNDV